MKKDSKTPKGKGKPTKARSKLRDTETLKEKFLEAFADCQGIIATACRKVGIARQTYYDWIDKDEAFAQSVKDALEEQIDFVETNLLTLIKSGDTTATIFYLKTRAKSRGYSERLELTGDGGKDLFARMSDEELQDEIDKLKQQ